MTKTYEVPPSFDLEAFLAATRAGGVKLSALDKDELVNGYISLSGSELIVVVCEEASGREVPPEVDAVAVIESALA